MKTSIIVFGETSNKNSIQLEKEYIKRITPFSQIEYIVLKEEKMGKTISEEQIKQKEEEKFLEVFNKISTKNKSFLIACDVKGKNLTSEDFAKKLQEIQIQYAEIVFVIGGSLGLSKNILQKADLRLSFSSMTFPHDLFRTFLFEQIYRGFMINNNRKYHR
ncbi:TPA: 23S rRNA (pseudouridine(1915)-N(3))-methyltransferase RlmH [Candidatus Gracilibacteria bacterium]|nr:23S rRNA (pseudouridine(1915)-N(3))-methyltransferase RlmH [Candidatus Gracilibacteria bacterium]HIQ57382.1 23S rRNA (pseudouridine(1915)-N(3))-methyltransferase RlmH [Candidatus Gracilibacteria bacterium]